MICMIIVNSQIRNLWDYFVNKSDKEFIFWTLHKAFDKYHLSIEIDIEQLLAYARKNGLEDLLLNV